MTASFTRMATVTASTTRDAGVVNGLEAGFAANIASLACFPLDPVAPEIQLGALGLAWHELLTTFTEGDLDIVEGDMLVVSTVTYAIRAVAEWTFKGSEYKQLYLTEVK